MRKSGEPKKKGDADGTALIPNPPQPRGAAVQLHVMNPIDQKEWLMPTPMEFLLAVAVGTSTSRSL